MAFTIDRFETRPRDKGGRVTAGWRVTRYSFGTTVIQNLRSGRSQTGVVDGFGNIVYPENSIHMWRIETEELTPFYEAAWLPPHWRPGMAYR